MLQGMKGEKGGRKGEVFMVNDDGGDEKGKKRGGSV